MRNPWCCCCCCCCRSLRWRGLRVIPGDGPRDVMWFRRIHGVRISLEKQSTAVERKGGTNVAAVVVPVLGFEGSQCWLSWLVCAAAWLGWRAVWIPWREGLRHLSFATAFTRMRREGAATTTAVCQVVGWRKFKSTTGESAVSPKLRSTPGKHVPSGGSDPVGLHSCPGPFGRSSRLQEWTNSASFGS